MLVQILFVCSSILAFVNKLSEDEVLLLGWQHSKDLFNFCCKSCAFGLIHKVCQACTFHVLCRTCSLSSLQMPTRELFKLLHSYIHVYLCTLVFVYFLDQHTCSFRLFILNSNQFWIILYPYIHRLHNYNTP